jgi:hypothetical protein
MVNYHRQPVCVSEVSYNNNYYNRATAHLQLNNLLLLLLLLLLLNRCRYNRARLYV